MGPNFLGIETCTAAGSVAVLFSAETPAEKVMANNEWLRSRSHGEVMTPALEDAVKLSGGWDHIEVLAVGVGPGSFTGIRVGLNAARTAAWNLNLPLIPVRTTDALIEAARASGTVPRDHAIAAVLNAQMGLHFAAWETSVSLASAANVTDPAAFDLATLAKDLKALKKPIALIGESADLLTRELRDLGLAVHRATASHLDFPHALTVARLAARRWKAEARSHDAEALVRMFDWRRTQPLYLRGSGAEEKMG